MTKQILAFTERPEFKALLEFELKSITGFAPVVHGTLEDLESMLEIFPVVELLVLDASKSHPRFPAFMEKIKKNEDSFKNVVLIGEGKHTSANLVIFPQGEEAKMLDHVRNILGIPEEKMDGWVSVPVTALNHFNKLPFDLYVRLSEEKYVKRIPALEEVDEDTIVGFKIRGILELHFHKEHNKDFSRMLINNMLEKLDKSYDDKTEELKARTEVFGTVKEIVQGLGLAVKVVEICESMMADITAAVIQEGGQLARHLERLKKSNLAFHYRFIELTCFLGGQLLYALDREGHQSELKRFIFAAYFCDITLAEEQHYHHFNPDNLRVLKTKEKEQIHNHAWQAANLISKFKNAPQDIALVIKQHHGAMDGAGLPMKKSPQIASLAKVLIIAQELAYGMLNQTHRPALEVLKKMVDKNRGAGLQEIVELFEASLGKE